MIAIGNVRLFDEVKARTRDLEESLAQQTATADVLKVISRSVFDLDTVLTALLELANRLCDADRGMLWLMRDGALRLASHVNATEAWVQAASAAAIPPAPDSPIVSARAAFFGEVINVEDVLVDPGFNVQAEHRLGDYHGVLSAPLKRGDAVIGVVTLTRREAKRFTDRQVALVQSFADQAVIAIENTRLFEQVQAKTHDLEESLAQQTATADVLKVISRSVFDLDPVLQTLIDTAVRLARGSRGTIWIRKGDVLVASAFHHNVPAELRAYLSNAPRHLSEDDPMTRATREKCVVHIPDFAAI